MMLVPYARVGPPGTLVLWVGLFGVVDPPQPTMATATGQGTLEIAWPIAPIRDATANDANRPLNHRTVLRLVGLAPGSSHSVIIRVGQHEQAINMTSLPDMLPQKLQREFHILLCSCYSQPEDGSGLVGTVVSQIMRRPDMTMMLGDQIYGDLPIFEDLPNDKQGIARKLGQKYFRNWASPALDSGGLGRVLSRAPFTCVADDHEYWNNYPHPQVQLPLTWKKSGRAHWEEAARELYEDYQVLGPAGDAQRIDIDPLRILNLDARSRRDVSFDELLGAQSAQALASWKQALLADRQQGRPAFGMLVSGQALFSSPTETSKRERKDAEMSNYRQFAMLVETLEQLSEAGVPVIYVTGDVHWGRVSQAIDLQRQARMIYEVIASPSRLIRIPALDTAKETFSKIFGSLVDKTQPWPRHGTPAKVPARLPGSNRFLLQCDVPQRWGYERRGDQVAVLSLCRAGAGIDFTVTYYAVTSDKALGKSESTRSYELRNL